MMTVILNLLGTVILYFLYDQNGDEVENDTKVWTIHFMHALFMVTEYSIFVSRGKCSTLKNYLKIQCCVLNSLGTEIWMVWNTCMSGFIYAWGLSGYLKITDGNKGQFSEQKEWKGKKLQILYTGKISPHFIFWISINNIFSFCFYFMLALLLLVYLSVVS